MKIQNIELYSYDVPPRRNYNIQMKVNKYDRQIRLWGQNGQRRLGQAKVALLGSSGAGIQALKNLVLPGVGHIDIWSEGNIKVQDLSSSFFYTPEDIGKPKAQVLLQNLIEMNPKDVTGNAYIKNPLQLLTDKSKIKQYNLLICSDLKENINRQFSSICYELNVPVIFITVVGFYLYVRNQRKLHFVESQNTTSKKYYMRLQNPFSALKDYSNQWNIQSLINQLSKIQVVQQKSTIIDILKYIPYPVILHQIYDGVPTQLKSKKHNFKIQQQIKRLVLQKIKEYSILIGQDGRENFTQASTRVLDLFQPPDNFLPDISIFQNPFILNATSNSPYTLQFLFACKYFYQKHGCLPQPTKLPDMHTSTKIYLELKKAYRHQHDHDVAEINKILVEIVGVCKISNSEISNFIENIQALKVIQFGQYRKQLEKVDNPNLPWEDPIWRNILLAIRAFKLFENIQNRPPSSSDFESLKQMANTIRNQYGFEQIEDTRYLQQICRSEGNTTISISSIAGAVAGQQAIKLITHCFTPVKNGYLYSGVHSNGYSISL